MNLHVDRGTVAPLLFIHGWGMHSGMWGDVLPQLAAHFKVMAVDLPGHGYSAASGKWQVASWETGEPDTPHSPPPTPYIDAIVDQLSAQFTEPLSLCGWSLGGQVALRWALRYPEQVQRLVLVAATPCFAQKTDWPCAMQNDTLTAFSEALRQDSAQTLRRFLGLQVRGGERERELLAVLRRSLAVCNAPDPVWLQAGLEILRDCDLREALTKIKQPVLVIGGVCDTLTPLAAMRYMAAKLPKARLAAIEGAAHVPFLSHPEEFVKQVADFLHE
ncbi:MAG TPA: pimeloyl-[acyl-carrier protein] methyl ester esterase [Gallionella sp.]|jgi:pimeloyl-[acyl-carrier protein] methyl ester esterase|nr:alpha/beta fold hydrolase [Gallionella sp.]OGS66416.1 MAG: pimeloyl-[acyl-carrier protein] methyl ester esterase [Gallionellales bacterium GWA2_54_124]OGT18617.1 MAG: pimeloyl-[acyl-carrier protein] methyl ester esterase [Gallionellales bacterium RIFOXYD12_FULL_53_10]HCI52617.1 pimeloyl-[acyl-carrier protein] methyl ester esterase [Gallionella sp.]